MIFALQRMSIPLCISAALPGNAAELLETLHQHMSDVALQRTCLQLRFARLLCRVAFRPLLFAVLSYDLVFIRDPLSCCAMRIGACKVRGTGVEFETVGESCVKTRW